MDLFIYASEHDTFGIAVLEAMASALPVVVNDWEVMKEITGLGKYASLYETGNIEVYASIYDPEDPHSKLEAIKTDKEWKVIETILDTLQEEVRKKKDENNEQ